MALLSLARIWVNEMQNKLLSRVGLIALTLMVLDGCSSMQQTPSPIETGSTTPVSGVGGDYVDNNPYGTTQIGGANQPVTTAPSYPVAGSQSGGGYVPSYAPVDMNAASHTVVAGDTVYNISKRYQVGQENLKAWNNLDGNNIRIGQVLRVKPAGYTAPTQYQAPVVVTNNTQQPPATNTNATVTQPPANQPTNNAAGTKNVAGITWMRPTTGQILSGFSEQTKGVNIGGKDGQPIVAAADGKVVYSGSGLRGYGNLIIIQHNQTYLTAYGNNKSVLLKEGAQVKRGQTIAYMGSSDSDRVQLHFEVREQGKPVNPTKFIPF